MRYDRLIAHVNALARSTSNTAQTAQERMDKWSCYMSAVDWLHSQSYWLWGQNTATLTIDSNEDITLPWEASSFPVFIFDTSRSPNKMLIGRPEQFIAMEYNEIRCNGYFEPYYPIGYTTTAGYSFTYSSSTGAVVTVSALTAAQALAIVGKSIVLAGEEVYYLVSSASSSAKTITMDRSYCAPGGTATTFATTPTVEVEPAGAPKIRLPDHSQTTYYVKYIKRPRLAINDTDDCGWDERFNNIMFKYIAGEYLMRTGNPEDVQRGVILKSEADELVGIAVVSEKDFPGMKRKTTSNPFGPWGKGSSATIRGMRNGGLSLFGGWKQDGD